MCTSKESGKNAKKIPKLFQELYSVSPKYMDRYALRLLLLHTRGATSFQD